MQTDNLATMRRYLAQLESGGDFADIPMHDDVRFDGPLTSADRADDYRVICRDLAEQVDAISVRTLVAEADIVHAVYDVDIGLASGPLRTSQTVEFVDGAFARVLVVFDAATITGVAS